MTKHPSVARATLPHRSTDSDGREVLLVPVAGLSRPARIFPEDYAALLQSGMSPAWSAPQGYVLANVGPESVLVARAVTRADNRHRVGYRDKDKTNLRRDNLSLVPYRHGARKVRKARDVEQHLFIASGGASQASRGAPL